MHIQKLSFFKTLELEAIKHFLSHDFVLIQEINYKNIKGRLYQYRCKNCKLFFQCWASDMRTVSDIISCEEKMIRNILK